MEKLLIAIIQIDIAILGLLAIFLIYKLQALENRKQLVIDFLKREYKDKKSAIKDMYQIMNLTVKDRNKKIEILSKYSTSNIIYYDLFVISVTQDIKEKLICKIIIPVILLFSNALIMILYLIYDFCICNIHIYQYFFLCCLNILLIIWFLIGVIWLVWIIYQILYEIYENQINESYESSVSNKLRIDKKMTKVNKK